VPDLARSGTVLAWITRQNFSFSVLGPNLAGPVSRLPGRAN
jgi:hypothetical protein